MTDDERTECQDKAKVGVLEERLRALIQRFDERVITQREKEEAAQRALEQYKIASEKAVAAALAAVDKAVEKAEAAQQRVNVGQNEFRGALQDQSKFMASRESVEALEKRHGGIELSVSRLVALPANVESLDERVKVLERAGASIAGVPDRIGGIDTRLQALERTIASQGDVGARLKALEGAQQSGAGRGDISKVLWGIAGAIAGSVIVGLILFMIMRVLKA